jgi:hypothetical protein
MPSCDRIVETDNSDPGDFARSVLTKIGAYEGVVVLARI